MQQFINQLYSFVLSIYSSFVHAIRNIASAQNVFYITDYNTFVDKQILSGDLISIGMTWKEFFIFGLSWFLFALIIVLFIKFICKIVGLFRL